MPEGPAWRQTCKTILHKLAGDDIVAYFGFLPSLEIYQNSLPEVSLHSNTHIRISSAMLKQITTEDELAFIVFHEISHSLLGHNSYETSSKDNFGLDIEREADQMAFRFMKSAGYNLSAPHHLIKRLGEYEFENTGLTVAELHPTLLKRQSLLQSYASEEPRLTSS